MAHPVTLNRGKYVEATSRQVSPPVGLELDPPPASEAEGVRTIGDTFSRGPTQLKAPEVHVLAAATDRVSCQIEVAEFEVAAIGVTDVTLSYKFV